MGDVSTEEMDVSGRLVWSDDVGVKYFAVM